MKFMHAISCLRSKLKLKPIINNALKTGFDGLELGLDGRIWPNKISKNEKKELLKINLGIHLPFNFFLVPEGNEVLIVENSKTPKSFDKTMNLCIKFANEVNAKYVVFHPTLNIGEDTKFNDFLIAVEVCNFIIKKYSKLCKSPFCIENVFPVWLNGFKFIKKFLKNDNTRICFDSAVNEMLNIEQGIKSNWKDFLNEFKSKTYVYHLSDILPLPNEYMHHIKLNNGEINYSDYLNYLKNIKPKYITFEEIYKNILIVKNKVKTQRMTWSDRKESLEFVKKILIQKN